ncbi:hypothetical protein [Jiulongibacter sediminis]|jgi:hypothetical protein|uniref:hypothetical protein n=1 Tax=Jiulongibacter sediminis TaxID=1605367 RepID=UPI0026F23D70|nr:hypothetical protein [Jiulongibacter sediminis]
MKKVIYTLSFAALAASASAQVVSSTQIYVSEGAVLSVGQDFENKGELINKGELHLRQNLKNDGELRSEGSVVFDGYRPQEVNGKNDVQLASATVENDVNLNTPMVIGRSMNYNQGVVSSSYNSPLVFAADAKHFGASDYSHSVGTVTKLEANQFEFPLGDGANYRGFNARSQKGSALSAAYIAQNPNEFSGELANGVESINDQEYWVLTSNDENEEADVRLINTYETNVAYLKRNTWTIAENRTLDKTSGLDKGVRFTSGRGKLVKKDIGVWPNPTQGDFNLKLAGMNDKDDVMIDVTNQDGRIVLSMKGKVSDLRKVYSLPQSLVTTELTVRVINGEDVLTEKLILNR